MITLICKSFRVRHEAESVLVPQLLTKADVAIRLAISERKVETLAASGRLPVVRIDSCVRFREADVLRLLAEDQEPTPRPFVSALHTQARAIR